MKLAAGSDREEVWWVRERTAAQALPGSSIQNAVHTASSAGTAMRNKALKAPESRGLVFIWGVLEAAKPPEPFQSKEPRRRAEVALWVPGPNKRVTAEPC